MTLENPPFEDVFPVRNGDFSIAILVFMGVCQGANNGVSKEIALTSQDFGHHITELPGLFPLMLFARRTLYSVSSTWMYIVVSVCNCSTATVKDVRTNVLQGPKQIPTEKLLEEVWMCIFQTESRIGLQKPLDGFCWHNSCCQRDTSSSSLSSRNTQI